MHCPTRFIFTGAVVAVALLFGAMAFGQSGTFTNLAGGSWATAGNWSGSIIADGAGNTADFGTLNLGANATVTLDGARTIGNLTFGDTTPSHNWILNTGTGGPLTLAGGTPTITVNNQTATVNLLLAGTAGLAKEGAGTLSLNSAANPLTGAVNVNNGTLQLTAAGTFGGSGLFTTAKTFNIASTGTLSVDNSWSLGSVGSVVNVNGGTLQFTGFEYANNVSMTAGSVSGTGEYRVGFHIANPTLTTIGATTPAQVSARIILVKGGSPTAFTMNVANGMAADDLQITGTINDLTNFAGTTLTKSGAGTLALSSAGTNNFNSTFNIDAGTVRLTPNRGVNEGYFQGQNNVVYNIAAGAKLSLDGDWTSRSNNTFNLNGGELVGNAPSGNVNYVNVINMNTAPSTVSGAQGIRTGYFFDPVYTVGASASGSTMSAPLGLVDNGAVTSALTLNVADGANSADLTISGLISDVSGSPGLGITKTGTGKLILSGANTYAGTTTVNQGTIVIGNQNALGAFQVGRPVTQVIVNSGGAVDFNGVVDAMYGYTIAGTGVGGTGALVNTGAAIGSGYAQASNIKLSANASIGGTSDWSLLASGYGATSLDLNGFTLTKTGGNTIGLVNTTTTPGTINVASGVLALGGNGAGVNGSASSFTLDNTAGVSLQVIKNSSVGSLAGGGATGGNVSISSGVTFTVGALNTTTTFSGIISGAGGALVKTGTGTLTLSPSAQNTYSGGTTINGGTLKLGSSPNGGAIGTGLVTIASGAALDVNGQGNNGAAISLVGTGVGGTGALLNTGGNTSIGLIQQPNITLAGSATIGGTGNFYMIAGGYGASSLNLGTNTLTKIGSNTFTLISTNITGTGTIDIQGGTIQLGDSPGSASSGATTAFNLGNVAGATLALGKSATIGSLAGGGPAGGNVNLNANTLTVGGLGTNTSFSGIISGAGGALVKTGTGTLTLSPSAQNTYSGGTTINGGTLKLGSSPNGGAIGTGLVTIASGAALDVNGQGNNGAAISLVGTGVGGTGALLNTGGNTSVGLIQQPNITLAGNATIGGTGNFYMIAGGYSASSLNLGTNTLTKIGGNTFTLISTGITGTGIIDIQGGTIQLGASQGSPSSGPTTAFTLGNVAGATLALGQSSTIGSLAGGGATGGNVNLNANTLTVGGLGTNTSFGGVISGAGGALVKTGGGTQTLTGANTYTGTTAVNNGTLLLNGTHMGGGAYTVAAGATLGGSGVSNAVVGGAGTVSPGNSPGILTFGQLNPTGGLDYNFGFTQTGDPTWSNAAASGNDVFRLTHSTTPITAALTSANELNLFLDESALSGGDAYRGGLFTDRNSDFASLISAATVNFFVRGDGSGGDATLDGQGYYSLDNYNLLDPLPDFLLDLSTVQVPAANLNAGTVNNGWVTQIHVTATPEPSSIALWALIGAGLIGIAICRRRAK